MSKTEAYFGVGKRKSSIARVSLKLGKGGFSVNGKTIDDYFMKRAGYLTLAKSALSLTETLDKFTVSANVKGGGISSQADSIKFGIAKAILSFDESKRKVLKEEGMLTRDARRVERKKYGKKKSRKSPQFSKR